MNVVDSSGWLEYFAGSERAHWFAEALEDTPRLIVPTLIVYEVFKVVLRQRSEGDALQAIALLEQGHIVELTVPISLAAAKLGLRHKLPLADSVILATARAYEATLWTQDGDFEEIEGVRYFAP